MSTHQLAAALKAEGFPLPDECAGVRLVMGVHTTMILQYDVFITEDNLARLGRAFLRMAATESA